MMHILELVGIAALWFVLILRIPLVVRHRNQLLQWKSVTLVAVSLTLYVKEVNEVLSRLISPYVTYLLTHFITLANSATILHFVLTITRRRNYARVLGVASAVTAIVAIWIYMTADPADPRPGHTFDLPLTYWILISGFRITTLGWCTVLCWYGGLRADHWVVRVGLLSFGLGLLVTALPSAMNFGWLYTRDELWKRYFPAFDGFAGLCVSAGVSLSLASAPARVVAGLLAYRRIRPLWLALVDTFPEVRLNHSERGFGRAPLFLPLSLRPYQRTIEIRDAMLLLRNYVDAESVETARRHVRAYDVPDSLVTATITACCLAAAQRNKVEGKRPCASVGNLPDPSHDDIKSEVAFIGQVAAAYFSPVVRLFVVDLPFCAVRRRRQEG